MDVNQMGRQSSLSFFLELPEFQGDFFSNEGGAMEGTTTALDDIAATAPPKPLTSVFGSCESLGALLSDPARDFDLSSLDDGMSNLEGDVESFSDPLWGGGSRTMSEGGTVSLASLLPPPSISRDLAVTSTDAFPGFPVVAKVGSKLPVFGLKSAQGHAGENESSAVSGSDTQNKRRVSNSASARTPRIGKRETFNTMKVQVARLEGENAALQGKLADMSQRLSSVEENLAIERQKNSELRMLADVPDIKDLN